MEPMWSIGASDWDFQFFLDEVTDLCDRFLDVHPADLSGIDEAYHWFASGDSPNTFFLFVIVANLKEENDPDFIDTHIASNIMWGVSWQYENYTRKNR
jgi:hypothetical protein